MTGEAGVGKTSVIRAATLEEKVVEGGALSTLSWIPYLALTRALEREPVGHDPWAVAAEVMSHVGPDRLLVLDDLQWAAPETLEVAVAVGGGSPLVAGVRTGTASGEETVRTLADGGFERVPLEPLGPEDSLGLVRSLRPGIGTETAASVVRRAGGNPLLLHELASGDPSADLRRSVSGRLRQLDPVAREAFALLALAGRPLPVRLLEAMTGGPTVPALEAAGLVVPDGGVVDVRHALLAEVALAELGEDRRRELHLLLGDHVPDVGESARHLHLAGDGTRARGRALEAAATALRPGERAAHLRLAAMESRGTEADELRVEAAEALEAAHDWDGVFEVLDQVSGRDRRVAARAALVRARSAWSGGRLEELTGAVGAGLAAVEGDDDTELGLLLSAEACRGPIFVEGDYVAGAAAAREVLSRTTPETPRARARAEYFLGTALAVMDSPDGVTHLEAAIAAARAVGDVSTEMTSGNNLVSYHESSGSPGLGADLAARMAARSDELGLGYWAASFAYQARQLDFHAGRYPGLVEAVEELARRPLDARSRDALLELHCLALVDVGRAAEAARLAEAGFDTVVPDAEGRSQAYWAAAEAALWGGEPRRAVRYAERVLSELPHSHVARGLAVVTLAWARFECGSRPGLAYPKPDRPMLLGVPHELAGLDAAFQGRWSTAVDELATAARLWAPYHVRGELRCEWAAAEMLRRTGEVEQAVTALTMLEKRCADIGQVPVLHRVQRSLRAAGERRQAPRSRAEGAAGVLTGREREVLGLVAGGLTNAQIAARLGITRRTVVALIEAASSKLGAENRAQAAALAEVDDRR